MSNMQPSPGRQTRESASNHAEKIDANGLLKRVYRRERIACALGFTVPIIVEVMHYLWLNQYVGKGATHAIQIGAVSLIGVFSYLTAHLMDRELKKYVPDATNKHTLATIEKLLKLDNPEAWRVFNSACRWASSLMFFIYLSLGLCTVVFAEPLIVRLIN
jgi:hypothetical protein